MPSKSKRGRGKHHRGKKKSKFRHVKPVAGLPQEPSGNIERTAAPSAPPPPVKPPASKKASSSAALPLHYEFIGGDLIRIGVLTGIIVILLIVAYYILT